MWCGDVTELEAAEGECAGEARGPTPSALCVLDTVGVGDADRPARIHVSCLGTSCKAKLHAAMVRHAPGKPFSNENNHTFSNFAIFVTR